MQVNAVYHVVTVYAITVQIALNALIIAQEKQIFHVLHVIIANSMTDWERIIGNWNAVNIR